MSVPTLTALFVIALMSVLLTGPRFCEAQPTSGNITQVESDLCDYSLNLDYLEADFYLFGSKGYGTDRVAPNLTMGGPPPIGVQRARLDHFTEDIFYQFGLQKVGHIRAFQNITAGIPRPLIDLSKATFAGFMNKAFGRTLVPPFDPYANPINFLLSAYIFPYVSVTGTVGGNPFIQSSTASKIAAGLLGEKAGQDGVIRTLLYSRAGEQVKPYRETIAEFTDRISELRNTLGGGGVKDEGLVVAPERGPEGRSSGNVIIGDEYSLTYGRVPQEVLRILYVSGNESVAGGFFPNGFNGTIARAFLPQ